MLQFFGTLPISYTGTTGAILDLLPRTLVLIHAHQTYSTHPMYYCEMKPLRSISAIEVRTFTMPLILPIYRSESRYLPRTCAYGACRKSTPPKLTPCQWIWLSPPKSTSAHSPLLIYLSKSHPVTPPPPTHLPLPPTSPPALSSAAASTWNGTITERRSHTASFPVVRRLTVLYSV